MSVEARPRRFGRRRADFEALEVAGESLGALRAELVLLREENARLKAAAAPAPGHRRLLGRARTLPAARLDDASVADETTRVLVEGLVIRESLLEICQEIERAMVSFEAQARRRCEVDREPRWPPRRRLRSRPRRPRRAPVGCGTAPVLLTTEGTYPYAIGGVSSWCDLLVRGLAEFDWFVLPIIARARSRAALRAARARARGRADRGLVGATAARARGGRNAAGCPARSCAICWAGTAMPTRCWPSGCGAGATRPACGARSARAGLGGVPGRAGGRARRAHPRGRDAAAAGPRRGCVAVPDALLGARTAAAPTPPADFLHVTAAGWSAIPAAVHRALHGTPLVLTEHGVYVREAYLAAVRGGGSPGARFAATRLARGLARIAYASADVICPVTDANAYWEMGLGIDPARSSCSTTACGPPPTPPPGGRIVVSVGRIDPLKDIHTMLRVAPRRCDSSRTRAFGTTGPRPTARTPTGARASHCTTSSASASGSASWAGRPIPPAWYGRRRRADDQHLRGPADVGAGGHEPGPPVISTCVGGVPDVIKGCGVVTSPATTTRWRWPS